MKESTSCWLKAFAFIFFFVFILPAIVFGLYSLITYIKYGSEQSVVASIIAKVDHGELVAASRKMIKEKNIKPDSEDITVPPIICQLKPSQIYVHNDMVKIRLSTPGGRSFLFCYREDIEVYGQGMITNGLWYGNLNKEYTNRIVRTHNPTGEYSEKDHSTIIIDFNDDGTIQSKGKYDL